MPPTLEQLEFAAKAAGLRHIRYDNGYDGRHGLQLCDDIGRHLFMWDPTTDKSASFGLMSSLIIRLWMRTHTVEAKTQNHKVEIYYSDFEGDKDRANMWAIFLCAVETGRLMS